MTYINSHNYYNINLLADHANDAVFVKLANFIVNLSFLQFMGFFAVFKSKVPAGMC